MSTLGPVAWPPGLLVTDRLVVRQTEARDRRTVVDLASSPEVHAHLGGPQQRAVLERTVPSVPGRRPGMFAVEHDGATIGTVQLDRRDAARPGHVRPHGGEVEISYLFLPRAWGHGYADEACAAVLDWAATALAGEPVVLCTRVANEASLRLARRLGFVEVQRFEEFGARQWLGVRHPPTGHPPTHRPGLR